MPAITKSTQLRSTLFGALTLVAVGCGGGSGPELAEVTGVVKIDGKPLPNALIRFQPKGGEGTYSTAVTNDHGEYELRFSRSEYGALPGDHAVSISTANAEAEDAAGNAVPVGEVVPARYNAETELIRRVAVEDNEINFDLSSVGLQSPPRRTVRR
jgi:hypothetical protein